MTKRLSDAWKILETMWVYGPATADELATEHGVTVEAMRRTLRNAHSIGWVAIDFGLGEWALTPHGFLFLERHEVKHG